jgi:SAM-dependent methyltransferase
VNEARRQAFLARALHDLAGAQGAILVALGDRLGLYGAMAGGEPLLAAEIARRTGTAEVYVRAWLVHQACAGYVEHDEASGRFRLPEEHAAALADERARGFVAGAFEAAAGLAAIGDHLARAFRDGTGLPPGLRPASVARGMARTAAARYDARTLGGWLDALPPAADRLRAGGALAELGCGRGGALFTLARLYPSARLIGFDPDRGAIEAARERAGREGLEVTFEVAGGGDFPGSGYDLVACFESFHEMADPLGVARRVRAALSPAGAWLIVEPYAAERAADNVGPWGSLVSSMAALHCLPVSLAQGGGALGPTAGAGAIRAAAEAAGFARVDALESDSYQIVLAARPSRRRR